MMIIILEMEDYRGFVVFLWIGSDNLELVIVVVLYVRWIFWVLEDLFFVKSKWMRGCVVFDGW